LLGSEETTLDQLRQLKSEAEQLIESYNKWAEIIPKNGNRDRWGPVYSKPMKCCEFNPIGIIFMFFSALCLSDMFIPSVGSHCLR
jgi:hypothetical protein